MGAPQQPPPQQEPEHPRDSSQLNLAQRRRVFDAAADRRDYFRRLAERMKELNWPDDDPLYVAARQAWDAAHALVKALKIMDAFRAAEKAEEAGNAKPPRWMKHWGEPPPPQS